MVEEKLVVSTLFQGLEAPRFFEPGVSDPRVRDFEWMTDIRRQGSDRSNVQDFGDTGGVPAAGSQQKEQT